MILIIHVALALLILVGCALLFWRKKIHSLGAYLFWGLAIQVLLSLPAGLVQMFTIDGIGGSPIWLRILIPLAAWPFNAGGLTVRCVFEATVGPLESLVGHRTATVMSNLPYYWFLLALQGFILAIIFARRYKTSRRLLNWLPICLGVLFLVNSLANVMWPWWGT